MSETTGLSADVPIHYWDIKEIGNRLRDGRISCVSLTRHMLDRIDNLNGELNAYLLVLHDRALSQAAKLDQELKDGKDRGPLHGVPIGVKDLCHIEGFPTTGGMSFRQGKPSAETAKIVENLEAAGAIILGKLNTTEGALVGYHKDFPIPVNPWNADYWPGVSSSGSGVAVSAGLCFGAVGSDTGGSIRLPAMANGVVGLKPTYDRVSREGVIELVGSLDHIGPLARTSTDAALLLEAMSEDNHPITPEQSSSLAGLKIGHDPALTRLNGNESVTQSIEAALQKLKDVGAEIVPVTLPPMPEGFAELWVPLCAVEALKAHREDYPSKQDQYGQAFGEFLAMGSMLNEEQIDQANALRDEVTEIWTDLLQGLDAFACPAGAPVQVTTNQHGGALDIFGMLGSLRAEFTTPANYAGIPTLTLPCGFVKGLPPLAIQFYGNKGAEQSLCQIGAAFELVTDWHKFTPID